MNRLSRTLALAALAAGLVIAHPAAQTASLKADFVKEWTGQKDMLDKIANVLLEREVIDAEELDKLMKEEDKETPPELPELRVDTLPNPSRDFLA